MLEDFNNPSEEYQESGKITRIMCATPEFTILQETVNHDAQMLVTSLLLFMAERSSLTVEQACKALMYESFRRLSFKVVDGKLTQHGKEV